MHTPKYTLTKLLPHVYHAHFESGYQLAMHFLRAQEYYESPKFANQLFNLVDYMEWYVTTSEDGTFSYAQDWSGFNVPSWVLHDIYIFGDIPDVNKYDKFMEELVFKIFEDEQGKPFYLIGTSAEGYQGDGDVEGMLDHELAHALYYVDKEYRQVVDELLDALPLYDAFCKVIADEGYHHRTVHDEVNAYLSTGAVPFLENIWNEEMSLPFQENFKKFKHKNLST